MFLRAVCCYYIRWLVGIEVHFSKCIYSFQSRIHMSVCHLRCCLENQSDRKWHSKDFTSCCPTSINWLITQHRKSLVDLGFLCAAWEWRRSARCQADGRGMRQWTTALKATNLCAALLRNKPLTEAGCGSEEQYSVRNPSILWRKSELFQCTLSCLFFNPFLMVYVRTRQKNIHLFW